MQVNALANLYQWAEEQQGYLDDTNHIILNEKMARSIKTPEVCTMAGKNGYYSIFVYNESNLE